MTTLMLGLAGCFLWSTPAPERPCEEPHLWYAPDTSGDVYFGCTPPEGWTRTPHDEPTFASPTPTASTESEDTGLVIAEAWVPPPVPDTSSSPPPDTGAPPVDTGAAPPDTGAIADDTGALPDTGLDTGLLPDTGDTGAPGSPLGTGRSRPGDEGLGGVDTATQGASLGGVRLDPEPELAALPSGFGGVVIGSDGAIVGDEPALDLRPGDIVVGSPAGIKVLTPADTGYFIQRDVQNAP